MESGTIVVAVILLLICIVVFMILGKRNGKQKKYILDELEKLASSHNLKTSEAEALDDIAVAFDLHSKNFFFVKSSADKLQSEAINLAHVKQITIEKAVNENGNVDTLDLVLANKDNTRLPLSFYKSDVDGHMMSGQYQFAERWKGKLSVHLKK